MVTEDQAIVEPVVQAPPVAIDPTPAAQSAAPATPAEPPPPAARVPLNIGKLQAQQQDVSPPVPVIQPRSDGAVPINRGNFIVAQPAQPAQPAAAAEPILTPEPTPASTIQVPPSGAGGAADPNPIPPAAQPMGEVNWEAITGGRLKTQSEWETFHSEQARLAEEVQQLKSTRVEFANPLVEKINDVVKNGGDMATVASLIAAQNLDPASMKPLEVIKAAIAFQHPTLDHEEVEAHISKLGIDLSDMEGAGTRAAIKVESEKASQFLTSLKVQMDNPAVLAQAQESQAAIARNQEAWKAVPVPATIAKVTEKVGDITISTDFAYSPEAIAFATQATNEMRVLPANQQNIQNYNSLYEALARGFDSPRLIAQVTAEAVRVATLEAQRRTAGPTPQPVPQAVPPVPAAPKHQGHFALGGS